MMTSSFYKGKRSYLLCGGCTRDTAYGHLAHEKRKKCQKEIMGMTIRHLRPGSQQQQQQQVEGIIHPETRGEHAGGCA